MSKFLVYDTETVGLILDFNLPLSRVNLGNFPVCTQIAWCLYDDEGVILNERCELVKPDGWVMPTGKFWVDNGFTQERSMEFGVPLVGILEEFKLDVQQADFLVAHNMAFDEKILGAEFIRNHMTTGKIIPKLCTKEIGTNFCKIPNPNRYYKNYKWPNLTELHIKLFGTEFEGAHDALFDVKACAKCFFELLRLGVINI